MECPKCHGQELAMKRHEINTSVLELQVAGGSQASETLTQGPVLQKSKINPATSDQIQPRKKAKQTARTRRGGICIYKMSPRELNINMKVIYISEPIDRDSIQTRRNALQLPVLLPKLNFSNNAHDWALMESIRIRSCEIREILTTVTALVDI